MLCPARFPLLKPPPDEKFAPSQPVLGRPSGFPKLKVVCLGPDFMASPAQWSSFQATTEPPGINAAAQESLSSRSHACGGAKTLGTLSRATGMSYNTLLSSGTR